MQKVCVGLEELLGSESGRVAGRRVGLVTNPTAVDGEFRHAADLLHAMDGVRLAALFGPEHGIRGAAQDMEGIRSGTDPRTGAPVHSLYGSGPESLKPRPEHLEGIDVLVFDIQDVGSRFYTYVYTMSYCMEAAAEAGIEFVVLDRPNPITGARTEGPGLEPEQSSFVGRYDITIRHGMTAGELARLFNDREGIGCDLTVVACRGWTRGAWFDQTGLPWVIPSPNMPTPETALVYPGMCLVEGTEMSEGRGTTRPFEIFGAPWVDPWALAEALETEDLPGVRFRPLFLQPTSGKHSGVNCGGVQLHVTCRNDFLPVRTGVACIRACRALWDAAGGEATHGPYWRTRPYEFRKHYAFDRLAGSPVLRETVDSGADLDACCASWNANVSRFEVAQRAVFSTTERRGPRTQVRTPGSAAGRADLSCIA